ncbi:MAG: hypothetical protein QE271_09995 [Bacteriovoracaceae bacterium]|nr:hypothetical protein [Bacteriovoracaceae bacterium]
MNPFFLLLFLSFCPLVNAQKYFHDENLNDWMAEHPQSIIYGWSQLMPLSQRGRKEIEAIAQSLNLPLVILQDDSCLRMKNCLETKDDIFNSATLWDLGAFDHFPFIFFIVDGKISETLIQGYEVPESLALIVEEVMRKGNLCI